MDEWRNTFRSCLPDEPEQPTRTLQIISAVYSGGEVEAGTHASDLTGIVVTAHYILAPFTETVTDWTITGTVSEGQNVITISYNGKTTTITVTGITHSVDPLYHFENYSKTINGAVINITDDNKVSLDFTAGGGTMYTTLSDMATSNVASLTGGAGLKAGTEWFKIPAGADVEIWLEDIEAINISGSNNLGTLGLFDNTSSSWAGTMICGFANNLVSIQRALNGEHTTYKATEEKSVRCLGCNLTSLTGAKIEAKVCVTINGVRYI